MKFLKYSLLTGCIFGCSLVALFTARAEQLRFDGKPVQATITAEDCAKCHEAVVRIVQKKGQAHQALCLDCHRGHPPADMEIVPTCNNCHTGVAHFELDGCIGCHINPHTPLEIRLSKDVVGACLTCHAEQIEQLRAYPSIHTGLACTACHTYHGQIQPCQNCHLPHSDIMGDGSCAQCHKAHMPLNVAYDQTVAQPYCGSCHTEIYETLADNLTRHRKVSCVVCHAEKHGMIPACENCHGRQHAEEILEKFEKCGDCHGIAHDLSPADFITNPFIQHMRRQ